MSTNHKPILVIIASYLILAMLSSCNSQGESTRPQVKDLVISVYAPAIVQPNNLYRLYPQASGRIKKLFLQEGDTIQAGQILAEIESVRTDYDLEAARLQEKRIEEKLRGEGNDLNLLRNEISKLQSQLLTDSMNYFRQKALWEKEIGSKTELEAKKLKYTLGMKNLEAARDRLHASEKELKNSLNQSKINLEKSRAIRDEYTVSSLGKGMIYSLAKEEGESISAQEFLAEIGAANHFILEMHIDEQDIASVVTGQEVIVSLDAYPDQNYRALISRIYPSKNLRTQSFKVEAEFVNRPERLFAGLSAEANIIIKRKDNVLVIPVEYLTEENKLIDADGEKLSPQLGERNLEFVEIVAGLDSTTTIMKP